MDDNVTVFQDYGGNVEFMLKDGKPFKVKATDI
jgi:hypothetical protein